MSPEDNGFASMTEHDARRSSAETVSEAAASRLVLKRVATIASLAILLGFAMQGLIVAVKLASGDTFPGARIFVDLAQGVTWSFLVCAGIGVAITITKARASLAGLLALVCAPLAIAAAKGSQKVMASLVGAADQPAVLSLAAISGLKAIEYAVLGWLLGSLVEKDVTRAMPYIAAGGAIGVVFGGGIAALSHQAAIAKGLNPALPQILGSIVNEIAFPIGCSVVIYAGQLVGRHLSVISGRQ